MKIKEKVKDQNVNPQQDALTDLQVPDEQAEETRAGASPKLFVFCATGQHIAEQPDVLKPKTA